MRTMSIKAIISICLMSSFQSWAISVDPYSPSCPYFWGFVFDFWGRNCCMANLLTRLSPAVCRGVELSTRAYKPLILGLAQPFSSFPTLISDITHGYDENNFVIPSPARTFSFSSARSRILPCNCTQAKCWNLPVLLLYAYFWYARRCSIVIRS